MRSTLVQSRRLWLAAVIATAGLVLAACGGDTEELVEHPGDCKCMVEVPVCLPDCLPGEPVVKSRCKLGRGVVTYKWCNGFTVKVVFRKKCDIVVTYQPLIK